MVTFTKIFFMQQQNDILEAREMLQQFKNELANKLQRYPQLVLRSNNVFDTLSNGLGFAAANGAGAGLGQEQPVPEELTHILGTPVANRASVRETPRRHITGAELEELRARVTDGYDTFLDRDSNELKQSLSDLEIRGVAKMAGMDVSETEPARITVPFINEIKRAITAKSEQLDAEREEEARLQKLQQSEQSFGTQAMEAALPPPAPGGTTAPAPPPDAKSSTKTKAEAKK